MPKKVTTTQFSNIIDSYYEINPEYIPKIPLLILGTFGIGKSHMIEDSAVARSGKRKRKYVNWNRISREEKHEIIKDPSGYFVMLDIRLSEHDPSDIKGLPNYSQIEFNDENRSDFQVMEWIPPEWAALVTHPESDGYLFFDEINLAAPSVIASVYKIIYDRVIDASPVSPNWLMLGAGNKEEDGGYSFDLPPAVKDRAGEIELIPAKASDWIKWAMDHDIDPRIIGYIQWQNSDLHKVDKKDPQKFTTPRGWQRVSALIREKKYDDSMAIVTETAISEGIARKFNSFCSLEQEVKFDEIIKNPKTEIPKLGELSHKYFVASGLADKYKTSRKGKNSVTFDKVMQAAEGFDTAKNSKEFAVLLLSMCKQMATNKFMKDFVEEADNYPILEKYQNYIL